MQRLPNFNYRSFFWKFATVVLIFAIDRASKIYLLNLYENGTEIDFYIFPFLNLFLIWNTGIGFGLFSFEADIYYQLTTTFIGIINLLMRSKKKINKTIIIFFISYFFVIIPLEE